MFWDEGGCWDTHVYWCCLLGERGSCESDPRFEMAYTLFRTVFDLRMLNSSGYREPPLHRTVPYREECISSLIREEIGGRIRSFVGSNGNGMRKAIWMENNGNAGMGLAFSTVPPFGAAHGGLGVVPPPVSWDNCSSAQVGQLAGYASEHSAYHHGDASLNGTIIAMAQNYTGSNNINLLTPGGQFGTRLMGGKVSGPRRNGRRPCGFSPSLKTDHMPCMWQEGSLRRRWWYDSLDTSCVFVGLVCISCSS